MHGKVERRHKAAQLGGDPRSESPIEQPSVSGLMGGQSNRFWAKRRYTRALWMLPAAPSQ
jgi:hypothetical protein